MTWRKMKHPEQPLRSKHLKDVKANADTIDYEQSCPHDGWKVYIELLLLLILKALGHHWGHD